MKPPLHIYDPATPTAEDFDARNFVAKDGVPGQFCPTIGVLHYRSPNGVSNPDGTWTTEHIGRKGAVVQVLMSSFMWQYYQRVFGTDGTSHVELRGWERLTAADAENILIQAHLGNRPEFIHESARRQLADVLATSVTMVHTDEPIVELSPLPARA
jgi:hypothetical protein